MAIEWFLVNDGKEVGPFSVKQIKDLAESGCLRRDQLLRRSDKSKAVVAEKVAGLFSPRSAADVPPALPESSSASNSTSRRPPAPPPKIPVPGSAVTVTTNSVDNAGLPPTSQSAARPMPTNPSFPPALGASGPHASPTSHADPSGQSSTSAPADATPPGADASDTPTKPMSVEEILQGIVGLLMLGGAALLIGSFVLSIASDSAGTGAMSDGELRDFVDNRDAYIGKTLTMKLTYKGQKNLADWQNNGVMTRTMPAPFSRSPRVNGGSFHLEINVTIPAGMSAPPLTLLDDALVTFTYDGDQNPVQQITRP